MSEAPQDVHLAGWRKGSERERNERKKSCGLGQARRKLCQSKSNNDCRVCTALFGAQGHSSRTIEAPRRTPRFLWAQQRGSHARLIVEAL